MRDGFKEQWRGRSQKVKHTLGLHGLRVAHVRLGLADFKSHVTILLYEVF